MSDTTRIAVIVDKKDYEKAGKIMPWGVRSSVMRSLFKAILEAAIKNGPMIYGAILSGDYEIVYKSKGISDE